jgi:hypothetical protein
MEDFISSYINYNAGTEVPNTFSRWSVMSGIGALLSKNYYFKHGHFRINPNMYCMLIGEPGTKKSSAIKLVKKLLIQANFNHFAPNKTSKEKFLAKLAEQVAPDTAADFLEQNIFGGSDIESKGPIECAIFSDEFNNFLGTGNLEFISLLGELWDHEGVYVNELKNSKSDAIPDPIISILSGNTQTGFNAAFPPEAIGQGFFSRLLFVYCDTVREKVTFPEEPAEEATNYLLRHFQEIRSKVIGRATYSKAVHDLIDKIYKSWNPVPDPRFSNYSNRRFAHLLKLILIVSASRLSTKIEEQDVIYANTMLTHAEYFMPKALGEFGKARNSDITHKIIQIIENNNDIPINFKSIWKKVSSDLDKPTNLADLLTNLTQAEKIQYVEDLGYLPKRAAIELVDSSLIDFSLLTPEELGMKR